MWVAMPCFLLKNVIVIQGQLLKKTHSHEYWVNIKNHTDSNHVKGWLIGISCFNCRRHLRYISSEFVYDAMH